MDILLISTPFTDPYLENTPLKPMQSPAPTPNITAHAGEPLSSWELESSENERRTETPMSPSIPMH